MSLATWLQGPADPAATTPPGAQAPSLPPVEPSPSSPAETAPAETAPAAPLPTPAPVPVSAPAPSAPAPAPAPAPGGNPYLVGGFGAADAAPPGNSYVAGGGGQEPATRPGPKEWKRFVFAILGGLTFGISPVPSVDGTLFLGGRIRGTWALGYAGTLSLGQAERYRLGMITHRHHLMALHNFKQRGFASVSAGVGFFYSIPALIEAEGRVGARLGEFRRFVIGGMVRLGYNFHFEEKAPLPQFGGFLGWSFL